MPSNSPSSNQRYPDLFRSRRSRRSEKIHYPPRSWTWAIAFWLIVLFVSFLLARPPSIGFRIRSALLAQASWLMRAIIKTLLSNILLALQTLLNTIIREGFLVLRCWSSSVLDQVIFYSSHLKWESELDQIRQLMVVLTRWVTQLRTAGKPLFQTSRTWCTTTSFELPRYLVDREFTWWNVERLVAQWLAPIVQRINTYF